MTKRRVRRKVRTPAQPVEEPEVEVEELEEEEQEEEAPPAKKVRRKRTRRPAKPAPEPVEEEELEEDEEEEEAPKPVRRKRTRRAAAKTEEVEAPAKPKRKRGRPKKAAPAPEPEEELEEEQEVEEDDAEFSITATGNDLADAILAAAAAGKAITIQKVRNKFLISTGMGAVVLSAETTESGRQRYALTKKEMEKIGLTDEYKEFQPGWKTMSWEEKMDRAEDEGVDVEQILGSYDDALVLNIYLTKAIHEKLGIVKWNDGFEKPSMRKQIRISGVLPE